eukprot:2141733-Pyramimonas_sp.AAC.1
MLNSAAAAETHVARPATIVSLSSPQIHGAPGAETTGAPEERDQLSLGACLFLNGHVFTFYVIVFTGMCMGFRRLPSRCHEIPHPAQQAKAMSTCQAGALGASPAVVSAVVIRFNLFNEGFEIYRRAPE